MPYVKFDLWLKNKAISHKGDFDGTGLAKKFIPYFESGKRIEVEDEFGYRNQGYVGNTTGHKPVFILLYNKRSRGSAIVLTKDDKIVRRFDSTRS